MKKIAIIYHSGYGHTEYFAKQVAEGAASTKQVQVDLLNVEEATKKLNDLESYDGMIWGSPTYMGSVSGPFKSFMDASAQVWMKQSWKGKWAAGFTVSGSPNGDKQSTLIAMSVFSSQHGMYWMPIGVTNETYTGVASDQAVNRLGSSLGAMAQAGQVPPDQAFVPGDLKTAVNFGKQFAQVVSTK